MATPAKRKSPKKKNELSLKGIMMSAQTVGMCVGPVVGSILFEIGGFGLPFYAVGAAILVNGVMLYGSISSIIKVKERRNTAISRFSLLGSPLAWLAFATSSVLSATLGSLSANLALYVTETMGSTVLSVGVMFGVWPLVFALTSPVVGWLCKKQGIEQFINPLSTFSVGLSFAMLGPTPILPFLPSSEWIVYVGLAVLGCAYAGCSLSAVKLYFVSAMDKGMGDNLDTFGMISSMLNSGSSSGTVWGAAASGFLTSNLGFPWTAAITSCVSWTLTLIAILLFSLRRRKKLSGENIRLLSSADTGNGSGDGAEETSSAVYNIAAK